MKLCVIPARGGSKRIPRKNIREFCGKPIIQWSIETALESLLFDKVIVSTEDDEIAKISKQLGAEIPFIRPKYLSDDMTGTIPVINHAINWITNNNSKVDYVCCIYATSPFLEKKYLKLGYEELLKSNTEYTFSATSFPFPIQRAIRITNTKRAQMLHPEYFYTRSQDLEETFHDAGQFYWGKSNAWISNKPIFAEHSIPIIIPRYKVQDIDTEEDWLRAEKIFRSNFKGDKDCL